MRLFRTSTYYYTLGANTIILLVVSFTCCCRPSYSFWLEPPPISFIGSSSSSRSSSSSFKPFRNDCRHPTQDHHHHHHSYAHSCCSSYNSYKKRHYYGEAVHPCPDEYNDSRHWWDRKPMECNNTFFLPSTKMSGSLPLSSITVPSHLSVNSFITSFFHGHQIIRTLIGYTIAYNLAVSGYNKKESLNKSGHESQLSG